MLLGIVWDRGHAPWYSLVFRKKIVGSYPSLYPASPFLSLTQEMLQLLTMSYGYCDRP